MKYTTLLDEILNNEKNLNIIVDKNTVEALIFKNNEEKYVNIKKNDLYKDIMLKLKNELTDMINNLTSTDNFHSNSINKILNDEKYIVNKKYEDYHENIEIRKIANQRLESVLLQKTQLAEEFAKNIYY